MLQGLAPLPAPGARVLVLGSMPGAQSLTEQRYYAHPRNAFWPIIEQLTGVAAAWPYAERIARLPETGIALWDVVAQCVRPGSLDQRIRADSVQVNDFEELFRCCPRIERIVFNGQTAARLYARHVLPTLPETFAAIERAVAPSTSPAHAAMDFEAKCSAWQRALDGSIVPVA
ncbi:MAG: DNA-deoxyinosine glycosylase [Wenzhouxiangellaceae bacterium]|nr:DNA-deoxyinosine glycosylase [Wenzhouxiangellaceae bacterium]